MTYFNSSGGFNNFTTGERVPFVAPTAIYCDDCADAAIPLPPVGKDGRTGSRHWETNFHWAPCYGAPCASCGKDC